jgi:hypothetical protein
MDVTLRSHHNKVVECSHESLSSAHECALMIRSGRYAIDVDSGNGPRVVVPNDTYSADGRNFTVVTGINGSGKVRVLSFFSPHKGVFAH